MESYVEIKKCFEMHIVPICIFYLEVKAEYTKKQMYWNLWCLREETEDDVRSPLHALDEDWGAQSEFRKFADSVDAFIIYVSDKISRLSDNDDDDKWQDDVELGHAYDKEQVEQAVAQWEWLEKRCDEMAGSYPA